MRIRAITSLETLRQTINTEHRIVYCNTPWSAPCQNQSPIIVKAAESYIGWERIVQIDIDKYPEVAAELTIQSIPTIVVFYRGKEIHRFVGLQSLENLLKALVNMLPVSASAYFNNKIKDTHSEIESDPERRDQYGKMHQSSGS